MRCQYNTLSLFRERLTNTYSALPNGFKPNSCSTITLSPLIAFLKSIGKRGAAGIRMLFQHDPAAPIGVWREIREDSRGLFVSGRLMREVAKAREVLALMRAGAIDGLSIGFRTVRGRTDAKSGVRSLLEVDLWEVSVVTFPMLPAARVSAVKGIAGSDLVTAIRRAARMIKGE